MRTYLDCIPCICRQALEAARFATDDEAVQERVMRLALAESSRLDMAASPPAMGQRVHRIVREVTGFDDPYREAKHKANQMALSLYPDLERTVRRSADPLETAVRLAIAANVIDLGIKSHLSDGSIQDSIARALQASLDGDTMAEFRDALARAESILYLGDNSGEIVLDRLLVGRMPTEKVTFVVRGGPVINDATLDDAREAGLTDVVEVIENGSDAPGTILDDCSDAFRQRFGASDLIVAKGQGNYETLNDVSKKIFFLLRAKCPVIARDIGCEVGAFVLCRRDSGVRTRKGGEGDARV